MTEPPGSWVAGFRHSWIQGCRDHPWRHMLPFHLSQQLSPPADFTLMPTVPQGCPSLKPLFQPAVLAGSLSPSSLVGPICIGRPLTQCPWDGSPWPRDGPFPKENPNTGSIGGQGRGRRTPSSVHSGPARSRQQKGHGSSPTPGALASPPPDCISLLCLFPGTPQMRGIATFQEEQPLEGGCVAP